MVVPGKPGESTLLRAIRHEEGAPKMPPNGKLGDEAVSSIEKWILQGAHFPAETNETGKATTALWSIAPLAKPGVPTPKDSAWAATTSPPCARLRGPLRSDAEERVPHPSARTTR